MRDIVERLRDWRNLYLARSGDLFEAAANEIERLRNGAVTGCETVRLTDEEREAIEAAIAWMAPVGSYDFRLRTTLQSLLARMK